MTNYQYNGVDINNLIQGYTTALTGYNKTGTSTMGLSSTSTTFTSVVNERPSQFGYQINGTDISSYCIAKYNEITTSGSVTVPSGCNFIGILLVGGGGGAGGGTSGTAGTNSINSSIWNKIDSIGNHQGTQHEQACLIGVNNVQGSQNIITYIGLNCGITAGKDCWPGIAQQYTGNFSSNVTYTIQISLYNPIQNTTATGISAYGGLPGAQFVAYQPNNTVQQYIGRTQTNGINGIYNNQNSIIGATTGSIGQAGLAGSFVYLLSPTNPGKILQFTIGSGAAGLPANQQTTRVSGQTTNVTIGGIQYKAGGGGLSETTATGLVSYTNTPTSTSSYLNTISSLTYGMAYAGGNAGSGGSGATAGGTGGNGYARIYFYNSNPNLVYTGGNYATAPFGIGNTTDFPSQVLCIWSEPNFRGVSYPVGPFILLTYTFNYTGVANIGTYKIIVDDIAYLYFNGSAPNRCDWQDTRSGTIPIINGTNSIQAIVYNTGGGVGFLASFFDSSNNLVAYTDGSWKYQLLSYITPSASPLYNPVQGGLWTTLYSSNTTLGIPFTYNTGSATTIVNASYYYTNLDTINNAVISSKIISNFTVSSFTTTNAIYVEPTQAVAWGFKATGFFVPDVTGSWTFTLSADDCAELWIGSDATGNITSICPSSTSTTSNANIRVLFTSGNGTYSVTLTSGRYYPILLYYGEGVGGQAISFTYKPTASALAQTVDKYLYYVNAPPIY